MIMNMILLIVIVALIFIVVIAAVIALVSIRPGKKKTSEVFFLDGADIDSGRLSADNNFFKGVSGTLDDTVIMGGSQKLPRGTAVSIKNHSNNTITRLTIDSELTIGREAAFIVHDKSVSRKHCKIVAEGNRLFLIDLGSSNHTYLNGKMISDKAEIKNSDIIRVGKTKLEITF